MTDRAHRPRVARRLAIAATFVLAACAGTDASLTSSVDSSLQNGSDTPSFLSATSGTAPSAPVSFWAKEGEDRTGEIFAVGGSSGGNGDRLVRLRVRKDAQIVLPNGTALATGDSVRITMRIIDPVTLATHFEPAGLVFAGNKVAQLTMWYGHTNASASAALEKRLAIFRQESATAPWARLSSDINAELDEVQATIGGFTNYVIAY